MLISDYVVTVVTVIAFLYGLVLGIPIGMKLEQYFQRVSRRLSAFLNRKIGPVVQREDSWPAPR